MFTSKLVALFVLVGPIRECSCKPNVCLVSFLNKPKFMPSWHFGFKRVLSGIAPYRFCSPTQRGLSYSTFFPTLIWALGACLTQPSLRRDLDAVPEEKKVKSDFQFCECIPFRFLRILGVSYIYIYMYMSAYICRCVYIYIYIYAFVSVRFQLHVYGLQTFGEASYIYAIRATVCLCLVTRFKKP